MWLMVWSLGSDVINPLIVIDYLVHDVVEPCGCQRVTIALMLWAFIWIWALVTWPIPHPIYVVVSTCKYLCLGMGHLLLLILPLWWSWKCFGPPCPLYQNCPETIMTCRLVVTAYLVMSCNVVMVMDGWWSLHVFSEPFCKCSAWFPNVFFITFHSATPEPADHSTLLHNGISVFGVYQEVLDGVASFEIHFHPMFYADGFAALIHALDVWDNYVGLVVTACLVCVFDYPLISACLLLLFDVGSG